MLHASHVRYRKQYSRNIAKFFLLLVCIFICTKWGMFLCTKWGISRYIIL